MRTLPSARWRTQASRKHRPRHRTFALCASDATGGTGTAAARARAATRAASAAAAAAATAGSTSGCFTTSTRSSSRAGAAPAVATAVPYAAASAAGLFHLQARVKSHITRRLPRLRTI